MMNRGIAHYRVQATAAEVPAAHFSDGHRPYATFVIAAANSYASGKDEADYVCDGVDWGDAAEIGEALDICNASDTGGSVLLLEGDYYIEVGLLSVFGLPTSLPLMRTTLAGQGHSSRIHVQGVGTGIVVEGGELRDLAVFVYDPDPEGVDEQLGVNSIDGRVSNVRIRPYVGSGEV